MTDTNSTSELSGDSFDDESDNGLASSSGTSETSDDDGVQQDTIELAKIGNELLNLPRGLCENAAIFKEFFSMDTWQLLSENFKTYLMNKHLPMFPSPADDRTQKEKTIDMLFNNQIVRFGQTPLMELQRNLEEGNYRPDVLKLRQSIAKSKRRERRYQFCENISQTARQLFISRERLLRSTYKSNSTESLFKMYKAPKRHHAGLLKLDSSISAVRAYKRFTAEMKCIALQCHFDDLTEEENNLDLDTLTEPQKESRLNSSTDEANATRSNSTSEKCIYGTQFKRKHGMSDEDATRAHYESKQQKLNHRNFKQYLIDHKRRKIIEPNLPEYETLDIRLRDVYTRAQVGGNFKRVFASGKTPGRKPKPKLQAIMSSLPTCNNKLDRSVTEDKSWSSVTNEAQSSRSDTDPRPVQQYIESLFNSEMSENKNIRQFYQQTKGSLQFDGLSALHNREHDLELGLQSFDRDIQKGEESIPVFIMSNKAMLPSANNESKRKAHNLWQEETNTSNKSIATNIETAIVPVRTESVNNLAVINTSLEASNNFAASALNDATGSNTVYELQRSAANESNMDELELALTKQELQPTSSPELIQETHACFFSLVRDFFCATQNHRMKLDELREKVSVWLRNPITALNDWYTLADNWSALLISAIQFLAGDFAEQPQEYVPYIEYKSHQNIYQWIGAGRDSDARLLVLSKYWLSCRNKILEKCFENRVQASLNSTTIRRRSTELEDTTSYERGISPPPPPRCPTTWTVKAATPAEVAEFQRQERDRFENPHRAYTYKMHDYDSVVGPVKGIYSQILALTKARGHSMMIGDRPNFVTILTLVRDATARLPNGEGTRADISELLKCSQYINQDAAENVLQTIVSGALDRMHTEHDPCVRYDPKRKIWIYLHRNRTEEEFERMHQQYQGLGKHKKPSNRKTKPKSSKESMEVDLIANTNTTTTTTTGTSSAISGGNNIYSLPALVPANPIIVNTALNQNVKPQIPHVAKFPPVPPLKYNIQPHQQQKSLLKTTLQPNRAVDLKPIDTNSINAQTNAGVKYSKNISLSTSIASPVSSTSVTTSSLISFPNKSMHFSMAPTSTSKVSNMISTNNTTPIIVATPTGLKTVHVSNATSVSTSSSNSPMQLVKSDARQSLHGSSLSATVGGKKVALNKPIIINQITQQNHQKNKSSQATSKISSQLQHQQQQQKQGFLIPNTHLNNSNNDQLKLMLENDTRIQAKETKGSAFIDKSRFGNQDMQSNTKNIVRILPSASKDGKSVITVPVAASSKQSAHVIGNRVLTNATTVRPQLLQKHVGGISIIANTTSPASVAPGSIVRMSSQAFASLQKKQTQPHVLVKPTGTIQQRVVMGKPTTTSHPSSISNKNILLQQLPATPTTSTKAAQSVLNSDVTSKSTTSVSSLSPQSSHSKIQSISANNLTTQQQKMILQNLKQTPVQFKTVQVLSNNPQQQQQPQQPQTSCHTARLTAGGGQALRTVTVSSLAPLLKTNVAQQTKTVVVSQPQNLACFFKTSTPSQPQLSKEVITVPSGSTVLRTLNNTTGQVISLEGLLAKQGGTLRVTNATTAAKATPQASNIIQLMSSNVPQDGTQYAVVTSQSRNIITVGNPHQLHTSSSQAGTTATVFTTPIAISVAQVKDTCTSKSIPSTAKCVASGLSQAQSTISTQHIVNANIFDKASMAVSTSSSSAGTSGSFKIINTSGIGSNLNIANIQGKQVILASKPTGGTTTTVNHAQKQQNPALILGGQAGKMQNANVKLLSKGGTITSKAHSPQLQTVLVGNQLIRVEQLPTAIKQQTSRITVSATNTLPVTTVASTNTGTVVVNSNEAILQSSTDNMPKTFILGSSGQKIRLQAPTTVPQQIVGSVANKNVIVANAQKSKMFKNTSGTPTSRVVLAVQGGGQIFLSPSYQTGSMNLKSLPNVKVVSVSQTQSSHDIQHQERTPKTSQQKFMQQSILRASGSGIEKS